MTSADLIIGIDGGGSGCRVALATMAGDALARAEAGPANYSSDPDATLANLASALAAALDRAQVSHAQAAASPGHAAIAGVLDEAASSRIRQSLALPRLVVTDDSISTVVGALGKRQGVVAAIGTGSFVARWREGRLARIGGWGLALGDQASGAWLGRGALALALKAEDGLIEHTNLTRGLMARFGNSPKAIVAFAKAATPMNYAELSPMIVEASEAGDRNARSLMEEGADYLTTCIETLVPAPDDALCLAGGLGPSYAPYLGEDLRDRLSPAQGTPLDGALTLARHAARAS